mgnify:FL=1
MQIGDKVKIISCRSSRLEGLSGVITREYKGIFGVMVEGHKNNNSQYGCYWLRKNQIILFEIEESEDEEMFGDYKTVQVSFLNDNEKEQVCMSKYAMYDNFEVGDVVVVKTGHHSLAVAKIASIDDTVSRVVNGREIVTKVDMGTYENRIASRKRVSELKTAMDVRINKLQRMAVLEMFSEKDPEMKALLDEYKALTEQKGEVQKDGE